MVPSSIPNFSNPLTNHLQIFFLELPLQDLCFGFLLLLLLLRLPLQYSIFRRERGFHGLSFEGTHLADTTSDSCAASRVHLMELRSQTHLHFIQAIKGDSVERVSNVDSCGTPALKIRKLKDVYKKETVKSDYSLPKVQRREVTNLSQSKSPGLFTAERTIKSESQDYEVDHVVKRERVSDDISSGDMTLKQIREQCNATKRKRLSHKQKQNVSSDITVKQEYATLQSVDNGRDFQETLSNWKSKLSKKTKGKQHNKPDNISSDRDFLCNEGNLFISKNIKLEVCENEHPDCEAMTCVSPGSSTGCTELRSSGINSVEACDTTDVVEEQETVSPRRQAQFCVVNEVSYEYRDKIDPKPVLNVSAPEVEHMKGNNSPHANGLQDSEFSAVEYGDDDYACYPLCVDIDQENDAKFEYGKSFDPKPNFCAAVSGWEIVKKDVPEILAIKYMDLPIPEFTDEGDIIYALPYDTSLQEDSSTQNFGIRHALLAYSCARDASWLVDDRNPVQESDIDYIDGGLQSLDLNNMKNSCESENVTKDDLLGTPEVASTNDLGECTSSWNPSSFSGPGNSLTSVDENYSSEKIQPLSSEGINAKRDRKPICFYEAFGTLSAVRDANGNDQKKLQRPPEKLLSGRKVISPASQGRLCKAMDSSETPDKRTNECKGKLYFSGQNAHRILKAEGLDNIKRIEIAPNSKQINRKPNGYKQISHQKGTSKITRDNHQGVAPCFSTGHVSVQGCSQNAIEFSQRQMRDIESLATKLTKELKSMKDIMQESFEPEASPSKISKHNVNKVKVAIENAGRAEETARRWLSLMERHCNRFCKLMRLVQDGSEAPEKSVCRKPKKITFADEAGGDLCHVKIFENDLASMPSFGQEKQPTNSG